MTTVVAFVLNDVRFDSRVLREAAALTAAGFPTTVVGRTMDPYAPEPDRVVIDGVNVTRVPLASGWLRWLHLARDPRRAVHSLARLARQEPATLALGVLAAVVVAIPVAIAAIPLAAAAALIRSVPRIGDLWRGVSWRVGWAMSVRPWARAAARAARSQVPEATIFWAHDLRALPAAIAARNHADGGSIVYDAHEIFPEAGEHASRPTWARAQMAALERRLAGNARAVVTVNDALAERLADALAIEPVVTARNCPPRWRRPADARNASPLRSATGLGPNVPIVLYHGGLAPGRGIEILGAAIELPGLEAVHLVFMGQGPSRHQAVALANGSGRVHVLDPVPPSELLSWVAGADVAVAPIQPTTLNHRLSSPNKVFEALAAGVPVVGSDIPGIREVIGADPSAPLGVLVDPDDPADVAAAIRSIVDRPLAEREALRRRCIAAAHDRWNWETESAGIVALVRDLAAGMDQDAAKPAVQSAPIPQTICFVLPSTGAFDARTARFASDLADRGHSVTVVARSGPGLPSEESPQPRLRLIRVDSGPSTSTAPTSRSRFAGPFLEVIRIARVIGRAIRQRRAVARLDLRPDIVHAMGFLALPVATDIVSRTGARLVYDARDLYVESNNIARLPRILRSVFAWREGRWARQAARVFTVNEACADYLQGRYGIERPIVVMNGQRPWQIPEPRPNLIRERLGLEFASKIALYHGGFMPDRGLPELIRAFSAPRLDGAHLVLMGSGAMEVTLMALAGASPAADRIHFLPLVPPDELLPWVASADVGVMINQPRTLNERVSTPNKLFECLVAGTPVVSSDFPERRRVIFDRPNGPLGRVCDPTLPGDVAEAIAAVLNMTAVEVTDLRERCLRASREQYGWPDQFARAIISYERITRRPW